MSFKNQKGAGEGLLVTSDRVVLEDFAVEDTRGDGIKSKGSDQITFRNLRVEWTNGPDEKNGAYGVYPVSSRNVLIEGVTVRGASDAGIYVGQSQDIVVRNNRAEYNVAGIGDREFLSRRCLQECGDPQYGRHSDLRPAEPATAGGGATFGSLTMTSSTTTPPNFAPEGNIVAIVPKVNGHYGDGQPQRACVRQSPQR